MKWFNSSNNFLSYCILYLNSILCLVLFFMFTATWTTFKDVSNNFTRFSLSLKRRNFFGGNPRHSYSLDFCTWQRNLTKPWKFHDFTLKSFSLDNWHLKVFGLKRVSHEREMGSKIRDNCGFPNAWGLEMSLAYCVSWTFCELHLVAFKHLREQIIAPALLSTK